MSRSTDIQDGSKKVSRKATTPKKVRDSSAATSTSTKKQLKSKPFTRFIPRKQGAQERFLKLWLNHVRCERTTIKRKIRMNRAANSLLDFDKDMLKKFLKSSEPNRPVVRYFRRKIAESKHRAAVLEAKERMLAETEEDMEGLLKARFEERWTGFEEAEWLEELEEASG